MNRSAAWTAAVLAAASGACASVQAQREREEYLQSRLDSFRFSKPLDEVWPRQKKATFYWQQGDPEPMDNGQSHNNGGKTKGK